MPNTYFDTFPDEVQQQFGKVAFNAFISHEPSFVWKGAWEDTDALFRARWLSVVSAVMSELQGKSEYVTTKMNAFITLTDKVARLKDEFENIDPEDAYGNNYKLLSGLEAKLKDLDHARLELLRANNESGNINSEGDGSTKKVFIPNVRRPE